MKHLVYMACFWNNLQHVPSKSKDWQDKYFKSLGA